jgi:ascorbate-specific PTS system EIIC-type component UlaA
MRFDNIIRLFGIIVVVFIFVFGGVVLFSKIFTYIPSMFRTMMGILIMLYGAYRLATIFNKIRDDDEN